MTSSRHLTLLTTLTFITPTLQQTTYDVSPSSCIINGDPHLYSVRIRSSFYLLFFSGVLASWLELEAELTLARRLYNLISIATIINLYANSFNNDTYLTLEWLLVFILVILPLFATVPLEKLYQRDDKLSLGISYIFYSAFFLIQPWVYFFRLSQGQKNGCIAKVFVFFTQIDVHDIRWISFLKASSILVACGGLVWICMSLASIFLGIQKTSEQKDLEESKILEKFSVNPDGKFENFRSPMSWHIGVRLASLVLGCCGIAFIEITLNINIVHFSNGVSLIESGQLVPFLAALFSLLDTMNTATRGPIRLWLTHGTEVGNVYS